MTAAAKDYAPVVSLDPMTRGHTSSTSSEPYIFPQDHREIERSTLGSATTLASEMMEGIVGCAQRTPRIVADGIGKLVLDVPPRAISWFFDDRPWWNVI